MKSVVSILFPFLFFFLCSPTQARSWFCEAHIALDFGARQYRIPRWAQFGHKFSRPTRRCREHIISELLNHRTLKKMGFHPQEQMAFCRKGIVPVMINYSHTLSRDTQRFKAYIKPTCVTTDYSRIFQ